MAQLHKGRERSSYCQQNYFSWLGVVGWGYKYFRGTSAISVPAGRQSNREKRRKKAHKFDSLAVCVEGDGYWNKNQQKLSAVASKPQPLPDCQWWGHDQQLQQPQCWLLHTLQFLFPPRTIKEWNDSMHSHQRQQQLTLLTIRSRDSLVVRVPDSWSKRSGVWDNFLLQAQGQLSALTLIVLISVSFSPLC